MSDPAPAVYGFGEWRVDLTRRLVLCHGQPVPLSPRAFDTLLFLLQHRGRVVGKDELLQAVWPDTFVEENNLNQSISALRRAFGERRGDHRFIATVAGRGYQFVADAQIVDPPAAVTAAPAPVVTGPTEPAMSPVRTAAMRAGTANRRGVWTAVALVALGILGGLGLTTWSWSKESPGAPRRIAVLPFKGVVPEAADTSLQFGMADALIGKMGALEDLTVRPMSAVRRYAAPDQDPIDAGRALGVDAVLDGQVQRWGDRIRVTARLLRIADERQLWAGQFDAAFTDIFALQTSISEQVTRSLALTLTPGERTRLARRHTADPLAYQLYMKARVFAAQSNRDSMQRAIAQLEEATARDPGYALAHAALAECYSRLPVTSDVPPLEAFPRARQAATRALQLDAELADAHVTLAWTALWHDWDWEASEAGFKRALALQADNAYAHMGYGHLLSDLGRHDDARREADLALASDPVSPLAMTLQGHFLYQSRRYDEAAHAVRQALDLAPDFWVAWITLAKIDLARGRRDAALEQLARAAELSGGSSEPLSLIAYAHAVAGRHDEAKRALRELEARARDGYVPAYYIAVVHLGLGDTPATMRWLQRAYTERDAHLVFLAADPKWDVLRRDAAFARLLKQLQLPLPGPENGGSTH
jgi:DNA-binding winged helix-turn-helix (wHTH) protein/TolB-like protein/Tfp pilus assembly protein PilF